MGSAVSETGRVAERLARLVRDLGGREVHLSRRELHPGRDDVDLA